MFVHYVGVIRYDIVNVIWATIYYELILVRLGKIVRSVSMTILP